MKNYILAIMLLSLLSACSTTRQPPGKKIQVKSQNSQSGWSARQAALKQLASWQLAGRAGVAYRGENWPFALDWQYRSPNSYRMLILNPLTKSTLGVVDKTAGQVILKTNGRMYRDNSAESLIEKNLGVKIPVKGMQYWVLGLLSPDYPKTALMLDGRGRPKQIKQAGWTIDYLRYQSQKTTALPTLIKVHRVAPTPVQVKLSVSKWHP